MVVLGVKVGVNPENIHVKESSSETPKYIYIYVCVCVHYECGQVQVYCLVVGHNPEAVILVSFQNDEESEVWIAENEHGGVSKASWLVEVGQL